MTEQVPWPKDLEAWEPELRYVARDLVGHLAPLSERVAMALGPLRVGSQTQTDEPNGYSAISRRGPYERLLVSEWALQLEHEDEFIRRATMGEQLFVELERQAPAANLEAWVLVDTGPAQLGAPRIGQLAALVAFTRRARLAGLTLKWAALEHVGVPPLEGLTPHSIQCWFNARTPFGATRAGLAAWRQAWASVPRVERDVWVLSDAEGVRLGAEEGWNGVVLADGEVPNTLALSVRPSKRRTAQVLELTLPEVASQVRLLRHPFAWPKPVGKQASTRTGRKGPVALHPNTELAFSGDGHRLLARARDGSVVALPIRGTAQATYGWPLVAELPKNHRLVAVGWHSRGKRELVVTPESSPPGRLLVCSWSGGVKEELPIRSHVAVSARELVLGPFPMRGGWVWGDRWFDAKRLPLAGDATCLRVRVDGAGCALLRQGDELKATLSDEWRELTIPWRPEKAWVSAPNRLELAAACTNEQSMVVYWLSTDGKVLQRNLAVDLFADVEVQGVVPRGTQEPDFMAIHRDGRTVVQSRTGERWVPQVQARDTIEAFAISPRGVLIAWRDAQGEVVVHSRRRYETVLRVHISDASQVRP